MRRIRLLHEAVNKGYAIGRVSSATTAELERLPGRATPQPTAPAPPRPAAPGIVSVASLLSATENFDAAAVEGRSRSRRGDVARPCCCVS